MDKTKRWLLVTVPMTCIGGVLQWSVILDRIREAAWGWYKFREYGGGGELTVSASAQVQFFVASAALFVAARRMKREAKDSHPHMHLLACTTMWLSLLGMVLWTAVLGSPLITWR